MSDQHSLTSDPVATPKTDAVIVATSQMHGALVPVDFARAQERTIAALVSALTDLGDWLAYGLAKADGAEPTAEDMAACERVSANARAALERAKR